MAKSAGKTEEKMWWWVEGYRKKQWWPLYCAEDEAKGRTILRVILLSEDEATRDKYRTQEQKVLKRYKDFRLRPPYLSEMTRAQRKRIKKQAEDSDRPMCRQCGHARPKKVKNEAGRWWRCDRCGYRWPRKRP